MIDGVVNGVGKGTTLAGDWLAGLQTGRIPSYALAVAGGLLIIACWAIFFSAGRTALTARRRWSDTSYM